MIQPTFEQIMQQLQALADPRNVQMQAHFGIHPGKSLGIRIPALRALAKGVHSHQLADQLWQTGIHEARILASMLDKPQWVTRAQMESWVQDFDTWDVCDQVASNLFDKTPWALECSADWCEHPPEFVCRAGFAMLACMAVHRRDVPDESFFPFFAVIEAHAVDERNFVKKAVNWALRQLGKRSLVMQGLATQSAEQLLLSPSSTARWVGADAVRELRTHIPKK